MTKTAAHFVALDFLKRVVSATPAEIEDHVGAGPYASKYICYLKLHGYEIETLKNGKTVEKYRFVSDGDSATRNYKWVPPAKRDQKKTKKSKSVSKMADAVVHATVKAKKTKAVKNAIKKTMDKEADALLSELGMKNAGEYGGGTYSVDSDWDSMSDIDIANLLK